MIRDRLVCKTTVLNNYGFNKDQYAALGEPAETRPNPHSADSPDMKLFKLSDVARIFKAQSEGEQSAMMGRAETRTAKAKRATERKAAKREARNAPGK